MAARGAASAALNTFTDGNVTLHLATTENVASMTVFFQRYDGSSDCTGTVALTSSIAVSAGGAANIPGFGGSGKSVALTSVTTTTPGKTFDNWTSGDNKTDSGTVIPGSPTPCIANGLGTNGNVGDGYAHFKNTTVTPSLAVPAVTGAYGGVATLTATLTSGGAGVNGKVVSFTLNGAPVGTATTDTAGLATLSNVSLSGINAAVYPAGANSGVSASFAGDAGFAASSGSNTLTVNKVTLTVTANNASRAFGAANPTFTSTITGFVNSETASVLTSQPTCSTTATATSPASPPTYPITCSGGAATNYTFTYVNGALTITQATLTVTAENKTKVYGAALPTLTVTYAGFVAGDSAASLGGTLSVTTTATATSPVGTYAITASGYTSSNYTINYVPGTLTVTKAVATVVADAKSRFYGAANPALTAVVTGQVAGGDAVAYTLATTAVQLSPVGTYPIEVTLGSNPNYDVTKTDALLTVTKAVATVVADAKNRFYGAANPALTAVVTGQVAGGDAVAYTLATTAVQLSPVGTYPIEVTLGSNPNYDVTKTDALLTVTKAVATVVADAKSRFYGAANPALTAVVTGQVAGGDAVAYTLATTAVQLSPVGTYPIEVTLGSNPNYDVTKTDALLTVTKAVATVVADAKNRFYGAANPALTAVVTGQVAGGDAVAYTLATTAVQLSPVGTYPIEVTLGSNPNYDVTKTDALLTVTKAVATVVADAKNRFYGAANPALTAVVTGQVAGGDAVAYTLATTAVQLSPVGTYPIEVTLGSNPNYDVTKTDALLTVTKAVATVVADAKNRFYGAANPALTAVVTGQVAGRPEVSRLVMRIKNKNKIQYKLLIYKFSYGPPCGPRWPRLRVTVRPSHRAARGNRAD